MQVLRMRLSTAASAGAILAWTEIGIPMNCTVLAWAWEGWAL